MQIVNIAPQPNQTFTVTLNQQYCTINLQQKNTGMFIDLYVDNSPILTGQICRDRVKIVREAYLGFIGDLAFMDTEGTNDPYYTGLGTRYILMYLEP